MAKQSFDAAEFGRQLRQPTGDAGIQTGLLMNESNRVMYDDMLKLLLPAPGSALLEIGFGNGAFFKDYFAIQPKMAVTGIDFSDTMLAEAEKTNRELIQQNRLTLLSGNAASLPSGNHTFDFAVTINTLYFWPSAAEQLREIKRVLKPGGSFLLGFRPKDAVKDAPFTKEVFTLYHPQEVFDLLTEAGFRIDQKSENSLTVTTSEGKQISMPGITVMASY